MNFAIAIIATSLLIVVILGGCDKNLPLPPDFPMPRPDLMVSPDKTPLPPLPADDMHAIYTNNAKLRGQCVSDRQRLADLQKYVGGLTRR